MSLILPLFISVWHASGINADQSANSDVFIYTQQSERTLDDGMIHNAFVRGRVTQRFEIYNPHSEEELRAVKAMGFTQVILDWPNLHVVASEIGLDIVMANWWTPQTEVQSLEKGIDYAKRVDPRRLVGVSMMDEPERHSPDTPLSYYEALYHDLRYRFDQELPGVELEISHWGPLSSWPRERYEAFVPLYRGTDRIRLMPYPDLSEGPLNEVFYQIVRSRWLMDLAGRHVPQVIILQSWVLPENPKLPTIDELRVMSYQAMLSGAETVSFFSYDPNLWRRTPGFTSGFAELMRELTGFSHRYREAIVESRMDPNGVFTALLTVPRSSSVSVVINTNRNPVQNLAALQVVTSTLAPSPEVTAAPGPCFRRIGLLGRRRFMRSAAR